MRIDSSSWHYRLFRFNFIMCQDFIRGLEDPPTKLGLCTYIRYLTIWPFFTILARMMSLGFLVLAIMLPYILTGEVGMSYSYPIIVGVAAFIISIFLIATGIGKIPKLVRRLVNKSQDFKSEGYVSKSSVPSASFRNVTREWIKSFKSKTCPVIEVSNDS